MSWNASPQGHIAHVFLLEFIPTEREEEQGMEDKGKIEEALRMF